MQHIIGLSGYARSGKDSIADILVKTGVWERVSFAAKLKQAVYALNPLIPYYEGHEHPLYRLQDLINEPEIGPDKAKDKFPEYRRLLQAMGTEVGRDLFGNDFWVDIAFKGISEHKNIVITDCRFPNEATAITERSGKIWRVEREGTGPVNGHPSETAIDDWPFDAVINNNGTLDDLNGLVFALVGAL